MLRRLKHAEAITFRSHMSKFQQPIGPSTMAQGTAGPLRISTGQIPQSHELPQHLISRNGSGQPDCYSPPSMSCMHKETCTRRSASVPVRIKACGAEDKKFDVRPTPVAIEQRAEDLVWIHSIFGGDLGVPICLLDGGEKCPKHRIREMYMVFQSEYGSQRMLVRRHLFSLFVPG